MNKYFTRFKNSAYENKVLIQNFSYLSILRIVNMLLPLVTYPYLIKTLGTELFGSVIFAQVIMTYFSLFINFGFNISATKEVSINRNDKLKLSEIVSSILLIKLAFWLVSLMILFSFLFVFQSKFNSDRLLYIFAFGICFNELLFPIWFFQGIEKMKYITFINLGSRLTFLVLIFLLIKNESHYLLVPLFNGIGAFLGGVAAIIIVVFHEKIDIKIQPFKVINHYFHDSLPLFWTRIASQIYVNTTTVIIGLTLGKSDVVFFDLANKIVTVVRIPITIFSQTIFPKVSIEKNINFIKKMLKFSLISMFVFVALVMLKTKFIVTLIGGKEMLPSVQLTRILLSSIIPITFSTFFGTQMLVTFNHAKSLSESMVITSLVYIVILSILYFMECISLFNMAVLAVANEVFLALYQFYKCKKFNLL